jgi:hypothetical protein
MPQRPVMIATVAAMMAMLASSGCSAQAPSSPEGAGSSIGGQTYFEAAAAAREGLTTIFPDAEVPPVPFVRFIAAAEWGTTMASCLAAQGFGVQVMDDGGIHYDQPPAGQAQAQAVAKYTCDVEYPVRQLGVTDADLRVLYDWNVNELIPCLEGAGYPVSEGPSFASFKDNYERAPWVPYEEVPVVSKDQFDELNRVCPQLPEELGGR